MFHRIAVSSVVLAAAIASGCAATPVASTSDSPGAQRLVVAGDSNSTGLSGTLEDGVRRGSAWVAAMPGDRFVLAGGWAVDGATAEQIADGVSKVVDADVLVVMAGTNDIVQGRPMPKVSDSVRKIVATVAARRTVVAAIAPYDPQPDAAVALNAQLARLATSEGWDFVDPWTRMREANGRWSEDYRTDGVHTTSEGYRDAASAIAAALESAGQGAP